MPYCRNCGQTIDENSKFCPRCGASVTSLMPRQYSRTTPIMLFVLGLFLIAVGIGLSTVTQTVTRYRNVMGFQVPYQATIQPYAEVGVLIVLSGIVILVVAFIKTRSKTPKPNP